MNIFKLMKRVLDEEHAAIPGSDATKDALVNAKLKALRSSYSRLDKRPPSTDYSDPATRLAYVFAYVTCHTILALLTFVWA